MMRPIVSGLRSYFPTWKSKYVPRLGTVSPRYCYSVWLRHLTIACENGMSTLPNVIAELGPGNSLGMGLAGLITGATKYYAFDINKYSTIERDVKIFNELVTLFKKREDIPGEIEFPKVKPFLSSYKFPRHILSDAYLEACLKPSRIRAIKEAILNIDNLSYKGPILIKYFAPWHDSGTLEKESVDMIYSQTVLEYIEDLDRTYKILNHWQKPGGYMSHQIDFKCLGKAIEWNGHWAYSDFAWKLIKGKKSVVINRAPCQMHINLQKKHGFEVLSVIRIQNTTGIERNQLSIRFKNISDEDLITSGAHILSRKVRGDVENLS